MEGEWRASEGRVEGEWTTCVLEIERLVRLEDLDILDDLHSK